MTKPITRDVRTSVLKYNCMVLTSLVYYYIPRQVLAPALQASASQVVTVLQNEYQADGSKAHCNRLKRRVEFVLGNYPAVRSMNYNYCDRLPQAASMDHPTQSANYRQLQAACLEILLSEIVRP